MVKCLPSGNVYLNIQLGFKSKVLAGSQRVVQPLKESFSYFPIEIVVLFAYGPFGWMFRKNVQYMCCDQVESVRSWEH